MTVAIDDIDVLLIEELQRDGRALLRDIAQKVGVSAPTVKARIRRLSDLGVIRKFSLVVDADKIYGKVRALLLLQVAPGKTAEVAASLSKMTRCREVFLIAGPANIVVKLEAESVTELGQLITTDLQRIEGVAGLSCFVITKTQKEEYGVIPNTNAAIEHACDFCSSSIVGKPYIEIINGRRYYFTGIECADAFKLKQEEKSRLADKP